MRWQVVRIGALAIATLCTAGATGACSANTGIVEQPSVTATAVVQGTITIVPAPTPPAELTPPPVVTPKLNVNTTPSAQMRAAFAAAGILGAPEWAAAIDEGRPYPTDDASFAKVRGELVKAKASPEVIAQIIPLLTR